MALAILLRASHQAKNPDDKGGRAHFEYILVHLYPLNAEMALSIRELPIIGSGWFPG
jgi:hypothetical protein